MASLVPRLAPGSTFAERFRIVSYLGQGSMGAVYRAEPLAGGALVALKIVKLDQAGDGRSLRRFQREVESGARIVSPYVALTQDSGKLGDDMAWLSMELASGQSLEELVQAGGCAERAASERVLFQLFTALGAAHDVGIVHRDLKPDNLRVAGSGAALELKVLDFGIAKSFGVSTLSGTTPGLGTPLWTAPEQGRDGYQPVASADVWSLGLLTYFVLTGHVYWRHAAERASLADLAIELIKSEIEPASSRAQQQGAPELPPGFDAWFARCVSREPKLRFQHASEAWAELSRLLAGTPRERPTLRVMPGVFISGVILSCVLAGLAIYWLLRSMRI